VEEDMDSVIESSTYGTPRRAMDEYIEEEM